MSVPPKPSLFAFSGVLLAGFIVHVGAWSLGVQTNCYSSGLGATECSGGLGSIGQIMAFIVAYLGTPILVWLLLNHIGESHAGRIAWGAQLIAIPVALLFFMPLLSLDTSGAPFLLEAVTQGVGVPLVALSIRRLSRG